MNKYWKSVCKGLAAGALLLTGTTGGITGGEIASAAVPAKLTLEQAFGKLTAPAKALKSFHLSSTKSFDILIDGEKYTSADIVDLDINRLPKFAAIGTVNDLEDDPIGFYATDNEYYGLLDGYLLLDEDEDLTSEDTQDGDEAIDPDAEYWVELSKGVWDNIYTKSQFDPGYILDLVKNYKKSMKVTETESQAVLTMSVADPNAAKSLIKVYNKDLTEDATIQPKTVTWKLYANKKSWQFEKLVVDMNFNLVEDGEKILVKTKVEAKYTSQNKVSTIVKPVEIE